MNPIKPPFTLNQYFAAWLVHVFTASAACIGVFSLYKIYQHDYVFALWLMAITVFIDAVDGSLARLVHVKSVLPKIDGALLDNIVDYLNYVITPCFFLLVKPGMLPADYVVPIISAITITSAYQFCQDDAKTPDHFFKGFPCYWNITVFYMYIFNTSMIVNTILLSLFCVLIFIPVKYVYPSRLDYLTESRILKILMHCCSALYGISSFCLLVNYPETNKLWVSLSLGYVGMYLFLSFYRTYYPMFKAKITANNKD
ncbi:TPA: phosphatidylcholine synthase [Legionella pneumophila subsp. pneumophila]|uniref:Phosphatidylcholine synthase n=1 Tax=Legionella pneumophila (strain Lens) TaxID=297245 RepID=Q5WWL2_LEGPL|nr:CDP-alcohol phosphatidyltransferase family protein [Legionella pneumophila]AOW51970.1 phosphatidylcholine synthase [Legionella pneumophila subsp. pneumophila]AOW54438.1 phosphatidylcholine synthase [Legionella pneumophila subsp. pneumophila]AOW57268.1 phosphatidylcholine synthase [Legionella pneumophila subsp. pneumophila]AOW59806.1 phosphatidylcholine synthase [Legionella pneumophila subsp. pneumophila]AOW62764.1 phosphatidylcholine synthase [Legionella pneumophila subsp. pneumophila]